jgi:RNA polymerase sigma-54 factor
MPLQFSQNMRLGQHMSQQMKLAPRMIQSMEILQMQREELEARIEQEKLENVTLEDDGSEPGGEEDPESESSTATDESTESESESEAEAEAEVEVEQQELVVDDSSNNEEGFERLEEIAPEWPDDNVFESGRVSSNRVTEAGERYHDTMANMVARAPSLLDHLLEQWGLAELDDAQRSFGEYVISHLDRNGRLLTPLEDIVQVYGRPVPEALAVEVLTRIQQLDPRGVGARDVRECLLLQLTESTPFRDVLTTLISGHLDELANNRLPHIQRKTGYSIEMIQAASEVMLHLDPFPGRRFESEVVRPVKADLTVELDESGQWVVEPEYESQPRLRLSRQYQELLQKGSTADKQTREYLKKKVESAKWLMEAIEQRSKTVRQVAQVIVDRQSAFLVDGPEAIVPLKMQQVADEVGVHVTTVSRAVDGKWLQTPRGLFALRSFFGGGTTTSEGEDVAWEIIRLKMKEIIENEDKSRPLSDDALVDALSAQGFQLARRTVTKYRQRLDIPSSRQRREF